MKPHCQKPFSSFNQRSQDSGISKTAKDLYKLQKSSNEDITFDKMLHKHWKGRALMLSYLCIHAWKSSTILYRAIELFEDPSAFGLKKRNVLFHVTRPAILRLLNLILPMIRLSTHTFLYTHTQVHKHQILVLDQEKNWKCKWNPQWTI